MLVEPAAVVGDDALVSLVVALAQYAPLKPSVLAASVLRMKGRSNRGVASTGSEVMESIRRLIASWHASYFVHDTGKVSW